MADGRFLPLFGSLRSGSGHYVACIVQYNNRNMLNAYISCRIIISRVPNLGGGAPVPTRRDDGPRMSRRDEVSSRVYQLPDNRMIKAMAANAAIRTANRNISALLSIRESTCLGLSRHFGLTLSEGAGRPLASGIYQL